MGNAEIARYLVGTFWSNHSHIVHVVEQKYKRGLHLKAFCHIFWQDEVISWTYTIGSPHQLMTLFVRLQNDLNGKAPRLLLSNPIDVNGTFFSRLFLHRSKQGAIGYVTLNEFERFLCATPKKTGKESYHI